MKNIIPTIVIALLLSVALPSCKKEDHVLPAITTEGKNTFGCLVNGELWLPKGRGDGSLPIFVDMTVNNFLAIYASNRNSRVTIAIIDTTGIKLNHPYPLTEGRNFIASYFIVKDGIGCHTNDQDVISGEVTLSRLQNQVISGTFEFTTHTPDCGDTIKVTEGRFDIGTITR